MFPPTDFTGTLVNLFAPMLSVQFIHVEIFSWEKVRLTVGSKNKLS